MRHGETGYLFDPDRPGDLARWVNEAVEDAALRDRMGRAGLEMVSQRSWHSLTEQLVAHYGAAQNVSLAA
ncbi:hypothetical protein [Janibacter sp. G56]|uniref:hypothetical protein n=1 Tax=Janibacter sp. G56 TaxID=3418717 RepID=UPI003D04F6B6